VTMSKVLKGFVEGPTGVKIIRDADSKLDYIVDLSKWLSGDTLSAVSYEVSGATVNSCVVNVAPLSIEDYGTISAGKAVVTWLQGGATGVNGHLKLHVTTVAGREDDFTYQLVTRPG